MVYLTETVTHLSNNNLIVTRLRVELMTYQSQVQHCNSYVTKPSISALLVKQKAIIWDSSSIYLGWDVEPTGATSEMGRLETSELVGPFVVVFSCRSCCSCSGSCSCRPSKTSRSRDPGFPGWPNSPSLSLLHTATTTSTTKTSEY